MKIIIVEDNFELANTYRQVLENENFVCDIATTGNEAIACLEANKYDIMLLDINLPDMLGSSILEQIPKKKMGVIMVTARIDDRSIVNSLNSGADDYITKPVNHVQLVARIKALYRRMHLKSEEQLIIENLRLDYQKAVFYIDDQIINLTNKEFLILNKICQQYPGYVSSEELMNAVFDQYASESTSLRVHVHNLKRKLSEYNITINSNKGRGYVLCFQV